MCRRALGRLDDHSVRPARLYCEPPGGVRRQAAEPDWILICVTRGESVAVLIHYTLP